MHLEDQSQNQVSISAIDYKEDQVHDLMNSI
jgi:hypothetical protein